jgi:ParB/RepB/Spo0J family partition protein
MELSTLNQSLQTISMDDLTPFSKNPSVRGNFEKDTKLQVLLDDIRQYGQLQPIVVRKCGGKYIILDGHRRYSVCKKLNKPNMLALLLDNIDMANDQVYISLNETSRPFTPKEFSGAMSADIDWRGINSPLAKKIQKIAKQYGEDVVDFIAQHKMSVTSVISEAGSLLKALKEEDINAECFTVPLIAKFLVAKEQQQNARMFRRMKKGDQYRTWNLTKMSNDIKYFAEE